MWGCAAREESLRQHGKVGKVWFIKTKLLWDSLRAKKRLQLLSAGVGSGRDRQSPIWAVSSESWFWFLSVCEAGDGVSLGSHPCPASGSLSASILPFFLVLLLFFRIPG